MYLCLYMRRTLIIRGHDVKGINVQFSIYILLKIGLSYVISIRRFSALWYRRSKQEVD